MKYHRWNYHIIITGGNMIVNITDGNIINTVDGVTLYHRCIYIIK